VAWYAFIVGEELLAIECHGGICRFGGVETGEGELERDIRKLPVSVWRGPTLSRRASMATVSLNLPRHTSTSWIFDAASGVSVKLRTTILESVHSLHGAVLLGDGCGKNASLARLNASTSCRVSASTPRREAQAFHRFDRLYRLNGMAQPALPDDILHVLCEELANQEQFDTLFNCACASRALAVPALTYLYR
jgi:hypothetical protein